MTWILLSVQVFVHWDLTCGLIFWCSLILGNFLFQQELKLVNKSKSVYCVPVVQGFYLNSTWNALAVIDMLGILSKKYQSLTNNGFVGHQESFQWWHALVLTESKGLSWWLWTYNTTLALWFCQKTGYQLHQFHQLQKIS